MAGLLLIIVIIAVVVLIYRRDKKANVSTNNTPDVIVPLTCTGVKCMIVGCRNLASHKIGEENIWDRTEQKEVHERFENSHNLTTYLCHDHFREIMTRDEEYNTIKDNRNEHV